MVTIFFFLNISIIQAYQMNFNIIFFFQKYYLLLNNILNARYYKC